MEGEGGGRGSGGHLDNLVVSWLTAVDLMRSRTLKLKVICGKILRQQCGNDRIVGIR